MKIIAQLPKNFMKQAVAAGVMTASKIRHQDMITDHENGMNTQQIADKYGVSQGLVCRLIKKYR